MSASVVAIEVVGIPTRRTLVSPPPYLKHVFERRVGILPFPKGLQTARNEPIFEHRFDRTSVLTGPRSWVGKTVGADA
jgi:hypothetical protein